MNKENIKKEYLDILKRKMNSAEASYILAKEKYENALNSEMEIDVSTYESINNYCGGKEWIADMYYATLIANGRLSLSDVVKCPNSELFGWIYPVEEAQNA